MQKTLKFDPHLVPLVLSGQKVSTWRLWDDKDLQAGDEVAFIEFGTNKQFASAKLTKVLEKPLGELTTEDKKGHETFSNDEERYKTYERYYDKQVNAEISIKIILFKLIS